MAVGRLILTVKILLFQSLLQLGFPRDVLGQNHLPKNKQKQEKDVLKVHQKGSPLGFTTKVHHKGSKTEKNVLLMYKIESDCGTSQDGTGQPVKSPVTRF